MYLKKIFPAAVLFLALPIGIISINPGEKIKIAAYNTGIEYQQRLVLDKKWVDFYGKGIIASNLINNYLLAFGSDNSGKAGVKINFQEPINLWKHPVMFFVRNTQGAGKLKVTFIDARRRSIPANKAHQVTLTREWQKVVLNVENIKSGIDKTKISQIKFEIIPCKSENNRGIFEVKNLIIL